MKKYFGLCFVFFTIQGSDMPEELAELLVGASEHQWQERDYLLPQDDVDTLYQMVKDVHDIFMKYHVEYWIDSGTLIGAVRQGGLLPWDDDVDLIVLKNQEQKFLALTPVFERYGYALEVCSFGYKIYAKNGKKTDSEHTFPWIDIFIFDYCDDEELRIYFNGELIPPSILKEVYYKKDVFPLRDYRFGPLTLKGPNNPMPYLNFVFYGWDKTVIMYNHTNNADLYVKFNSEVHKHALPSGLLQDHVAELV